MKSREVRLERRPEGAPVPEDFRLVETEIDDPGPGEVVVRNVCMSVDPYMRGRMRARKSYAPPYELGEPMYGGAIGRVVASEDPALSPGDYVESYLGWREAFRCKAGDVTPLGVLEAPPSAYLGVMGMPGRTAYVGLFGAAALQDGETVFVSGAAGAVGSTAGQIAKIHGCRVIGSAGSEEKVRYLEDELGFDAAFDYKALDHEGGELRARLRKVAPDGIDVYFDNVGGNHLEAALDCMRRFGRIAICGAISQYNATEPEPGPRNLFNAIGLGLTLRGFLVWHFDHMQDEFRARMAEWLRTGEVTYRETVVNGIDHAVEAFLGLFTGANVGKMIVKLEE